MTEILVQREEIPLARTWDAASVFPSHHAWEAALHDLEGDIEAMKQRRGSAAASAESLLAALDQWDRMYARFGKIYVYSTMFYAVDTADQAAKAMSDRAGTAYGRVIAAASYLEPEILAVEDQVLASWLDSVPELGVYRHYLQTVRRRRGHIRSAEVEELLGLVQDPFESATATHAILTDTDLEFDPARGTGMGEFEVAQGTVEALLTNADREVRRTAWEHFADSHLSFANTMASSVATGVKQHVFNARARRYDSSLAAALHPANIPIDVFHNLISTYRSHLPTWHRYWEVRRRALGVDRLHPYDIWAPLAAHPPVIPYDRAVEMIAGGMAPLGPEYVDVMRRGCLDERWVDVYPNRGKTAGAFSDGWPGTHPFILMSYTDDVASLSTLAHELGHSMHSYYAWTSQPQVYGDYSMFVAETASNFNQALVRAHLLERETDPDFQISLIEEAMSNFHRYFFIMPTLARLELEIHERVERGEALTADVLNGLTVEYFREGYGAGVEVDEARVGITWAQFAHHMYGNFYVFQYATGISAAHALAERVLRGGADAAERYLAFLRAGASIDALDALRLAGVDMTTPAPVEETFGVLAGLVDRLEELVEGRMPVR